MIEAVAEAYSTMLGYRFYEMPTSPMLPFLSDSASDGRTVDGARWPKFVIGLLEAAGVAAEWERLGLIEIAEPRLVPDRAEEITRRFGELIHRYAGEWWDELAVRAALPVALGADASGMDANAARTRVGFSRLARRPNPGPHVAAGARLRLGARTRRGASASPARTGSGRGARRAGGGCSGHGREPSSGSARPAARRLQGDRHHSGGGGPDGGARLLADFGAEVVKIGELHAGGHRRHSRPSPPGEADDPDGHQGTRRSRAQTPANR